MASPWWLATQGSPRSALSPRTRTPRLQARKTRRATHPPPDTPTEPDPAPKSRTPREGTKQDILIAGLHAPDAATIEEIMAATGWQSNNVRGAMAGALKKKLGLEDTSEKVEVRGRMYCPPQF